MIILTPGFPKDEADTACLPTQQVLIRAINKCYPTLKIVILSFHYPFMHGEYEWNGNKVISFDGRNKGKLQSIRVWRQVWKTLRQLNKEHNIAGILSFWHTECAFVGSYFARRNNLQHKNWILGQDAKKGNKYMKLAKMKSSDLVALSDFIAAEFDKNYGMRPGHVIPLGIELAMFHNVAVERTIDLIGVGSLIPLKQYEVFIEVVHEVKKQMPDITAVICGKGPQNENLEDRITQLELKGTVKLKGELGHQHAIDLMQQSKILLHTSEYEGFGTVMAEALYAGAKVISFVQPMNEEIENWYIAKDKKEMVDIAVRLLQNSATLYQPVLYRSGEDVAMEMMALFDIK